MAHSMGAQLRQCVIESSSVQLLGVVNAYAARLAESAGGQALYLSEFRMPRMACLIWA